MSDFQSAAFKTERLEVFVVDGPQTEMFTLPRLQFLAYHRIDDRPMLVANALITPKIAGVENYVDWLEVSSEYRLQGYGREFREGLERHIGELTTDAGSADGEAFLTALGII